MPYIRSLMTMKVIYSLLRDNFVNELVSDRANIFRETTPTRPPTHSRVQGHLSGNVQRGACGSPAGGRMRATAAKERKKRKELLGGGKTPSLCPRHRHRSCVVVPRRRRGPTGKRQRRGWEAAERRVKAGRMRLLSTGWGNLRMVDWWGPPKSAVFLCR